MGVVHSMDEEQVHRISHALRDSAAAIQGINDKFDVVDSHWEKMNEHQKLVSDRIDETLDSFALMEDTFTDRVETVLKVVNYATDELTNALEDALILLSRLDVRKKQMELPKIIIPLAMPLLVLLIELAVANAYLGILLASLPEVREKYSRYLVGNASSVLIGLSVSLLWLGGYRLWLSNKSRSLQRKGAYIKQKFQTQFDKIGAGFKESKPETTITDDSDLSKVPSGELDGTPRQTQTHSTSWSEEHSTGDPASIIPRQQSGTSKGDGQLSFSRSGRGENSGSSPRRIYSEERISDRTSDLRRDRRTKLLERRAERMAALDPESLSGRIQKKMSDREGDLEHQVRTLRARTEARRASLLREGRDPDSNSPKGSKRNSCNSRLSDGRRTTEPCVGNSDTDAMASSAGSRDRFHTWPDSPGQSPVANDTGGMKPHIVREGLLVNPLDMQVHWAPGRQTGSGNNDRYPENRSTARTTARDNRNQRERQEPDAPFSLVSSVPSSTEATLCQLSDEVAARFAVEQSASSGTQIRSNESTI